MENQQLMILTKVLEIMAKLLLLGNRKTLLPPLSGNQPGQENTIGIMHLKKQKHEFNLCLYALNQV